MFYNFLKIYYRCLAYAKALYYRENEFETANEYTIESLISLYTNLG